MTYKLSPMSISNFQLSICQSGCVLVSIKENIIDIEIIELHALLHKKNIQAVERINKVWANLLKNSYKSRFHDDYHTEVLIN